MDNIWSFIILAFSAGLAALLTPCVFPMIPLTVSYFGKNNKEVIGINGTEPTKKNKGLKQALLYGFFIVLIYVVAGTLVARINGPEFANWLGLPNKRPDLIIRFGRAPALPRSLRRPVSEVII